jgi:hypothetical protein
MAKTFTGGSALVEARIVEMVASHLINVEAMA